MVQYKDIPQPQDQRNQSQQDILNNYRYLINLSAPGPSTGILPVDHFATGDNGANPSDGFHKQISFQNRTAPVSLVNATNGQSSSAIGYTTNDNNGAPQQHLYIGSVDYQITPCLPLRFSVNFSVDQTTFAVTINSTYNITSVTRTALGLYTLAFTVPTPTNFYVVSGMAMPEATNRTRILMIAGDTTYNNSVTTSSLKVQFQNSGGSLNDPINAMIQAHGG